MYILRTEAAFDSAHFLSGYEGKCANLHGHRWKVSAEIFSERLHDSGQLRGMVVDFGDFKKALRQLAGELDHSFIYERGTLRDSTISALREEKFRLIEVPFRPTAENFAEFFFLRLRDKGYRVKRVTVYETPENCAVYEEG